MFLAMLVWLSHAYTLVGKSWNEPILIASKGKFGIGTLALDCFMFLSGYLLMDAYSNRSNRLFFWKRRFLRIYPPFATSLLVIAVIGFLLSENKVSTYFCNNDFYKFIGNLSLFHQHFLLPGVFKSDTHAFHSVDGSIWSLPYEMLMYAIIPFVLWINNKNKSNLILILFAVLFVYLNKHKLVQLPLFDLNVLVHLCIPFLIGVFLANSFEKIHLLITLLVLSILCICDVMYLSSVLVFTFEALLMFLILNFYKRSQFFSDWIFPDLSYGIFLYGFFIQRACIDLFPLPAFGYNFYLLMSLLGTIIFALFSWYCIEVPFMKFKQKIA
jgi:peptidoglycan/LPS O-acetylase OafA/YrhL